MSSARKFKGKIFHEGGYIVEHDGSDIEWVRASDYEALERMHEQSEHLRITTNKDLIACKEMHQQTLRDLDSLKQENERLRKECDIRKHAVDRWVPCSDHRDKVSPGVCLACQVETLKRTLAEREGEIERLQTLTDHLTKRGTNE